MKTLVLFLWAFLVETFRKDVIPEAFRTQQTSLLETGRKLLKRIESTLSAEKAHSLSHEQPTE